MKAYEEGMEFERKVAAIFRALGATVERNVSLAGNQIDIVIRENTRSGATIRSAVECKNFSKLVGVDTVNAFAALGLLLRNRNLVDKSILVAKSGFTTHARVAAREHGVELQEYADLEQKVKGKEKELLQAEGEVEEEEERFSRSTTRAVRAFVVMPFSSEFDDVYVLGIREVAEQLGMVVERADSIEHNQSIPEMIRDRIGQCDVVIADTSKPNPNVFYEVGLANGMQKKTILICRDAQTIPFDLSSINHIVYASIVELREKLKARLKATLNL